MAEIKSILKGMDQLPESAWGQIGTGSSSLSAAALYEYGKMRLLHQGGGVDVLPVYWGKATFSSNDPVWGVEFDWVKDLISERRFEFVFRFDLLPDVILVDGQIRWTRVKSETSIDKVIFSYIPQKPGPVKLTFIKDASYRKPEMADKGIRFGDLTGCLIREQCGPVEYKSYDLLPELICTEVTPVLTDRDFADERLVEPDLTPIPQVSWQTMPVKVINETVDSYWPNIAHFTTEPSDQSIKHLIDTIPILEANGVDGMMLYHLTDDLLDALADSQLRSFLVATCSAGEWWGPCGSDIHVSRPQYQMGLDICNRLQDRIDDCHVYIWFPEIDERQRDLLSSPEIKESIQQSKHGLGSLQVDDTTDNEFWVVDLFAEHNRRWKEEYWNKITDPTRATAVYQAGNQFMVTGLKDGGSDMTVNKAIFRGCINTTIAAGRGTMKAHGQPHGYDYDPHSWHFRMNHHPDEWKQGIKAYLHAGCSFLFHEGALLRRDHDGLVKTTQTGKAFFETVRYARTHPSVGKQVVKMAGMQGSGDHTRCYLPRFMPQCATEFGHPADWMDLRFSDWNLLDVFFPKLGDWTVGNYERMMTGTPYGPLDIIPWDTDYEVIKDYDFVFLLGTNGCTSRQFDIFTRYVEDGGTMVLSLGQLRRQEVVPRRIISGDLKYFAGIHVDLETEEVTEDTAKVIYRFNDSAKLLVNKVGKGRVYLFTTNNLTCMGQQQPSKILIELACQSRFVDFEPFCDWLEIMTSRKGKALSLCVFNHGQIGFPSGNGPQSGPWNGTISVDLEKLDMTDKNVVVRKVIDAYKLCPVKADVVGRTIVFKETVECFSEFVIAPEKMLKDWFNAL